MLQIACPHCGPRDETEFECGGENQLHRPGLDVSDEGWADYLFFRRNPRGASKERWRHAFGCGSWFSVTRDTLTHEISCVRAIADMPQEAR